MRTKIKNHLLLACSILASATLQPVQSTESAPIEETQKPDIQLAKGIGDTLEAPLGTGANTLLKINLDLKELKRWTKPGRLEVPAKVFLTDFSSSPLNQPVFNFQVGIDCELTPLNCVFPDKPKSFDSYDQFTHWLEQGYFTNQVRFTYEFHLDIQKSTPSLAKQVYFTPPDGYHFAGTYAIDNPKITPDSCIPKISYISERGDLNMTTITLGGDLYLDKKGYSIDNYQQIIPHTILKETIFKPLEGERTPIIYSSKWIAREITVKTTYQEIPNQHLTLWPDVPSATYNVIHLKPTDLDKIIHIACFDGRTGETIKIPDEKVFFLLTDSANGEPPQFTEVIVRDKDGHKYIMQYVYDNDSKFAIKTRTDIENAEKTLAEWQQTKANFAYNYGEYIKVEFGYDAPYVWKVDIKSIDGRKDSKYQRYTSFKHQELEAQNSKANQEIEKARINVAKLMKDYLAATGQYHPHWNNFFKEKI